MRNRTTMTHTKEKNQFMQTNPESTQMSEKRMLKQFLGLYSIGSKKREKDLTCSIQTWEKQGN